MNKADEGQNINSISDFPDAGKQMFFKYSFPEMGMHRPRHRYNREASQTSLAILPSCLPLKNVWRGATEQSPGVHYVTQN